MAGKGKESAWFQQPAPSSVLASKTSKSKLQQSGAAHPSSSLSGTHGYSSGAPSFSGPHGNSSGSSFYSSDQKMSGASSFSGTHGSSSGSSFYSADQKTMNSSGATSFSGTQGNSSWTSLFSTGQKARSHGISTGESFSSGYSQANSMYQPSSSYSKKSINTVSSGNPYPYQVPKPSNTAASAELKQQLDKEKAEVVRLKGLLLKKETGAGQTLKAEHTAELRTLKEAVHRSKTELALEQRRALVELQKKDEELATVRKQSREAESKLKSSAESRKELERSYDQLNRKNQEILLKNESGARQTLKAEHTIELRTLKEAVHRLKTDLALEQRRTLVELQKKDEELASVRKQLGEAESKFKSSAESRKELERSYDQLNRKNQELLLKKETGGGQALKAEHTTELRTLKETVRRLSGLLTEERDTVRVTRMELKTEKDVVHSLRGELQTERAEVVRLNGLLLKKETGAVQTLKAEHNTELKTLKEAVHRLKTELALEQRRAQELPSVRKQLREAESKLKSSELSQKELQISYDQLDKKKKGLNRSKIMVEVYENYRRWCEDQSCRSLGMKKYDPRKLEMAVNMVESIGKTRYGVVCKSILDQKDVVIEIITNKSHQKQQDFHQKVAILARIQHPNLVSYLGGYEEKYALICEHLPNGTLQDRLVNNRHTASFSWEERVRVSASICSTLLYLHNTKPSPIIHGDLEAQRISFDADNVCRLSVFGMSHSTQHTNNNNNNNNTVPSVQSDIRDFGIVLLQIVTGQGEKDLVRKKVLEMGDVNLFQVKDIGWQREVLTNKQIVDGRLGNWPTKDAVKMLLLGLRCSHPEENQRPCLATEVWTQIQSIKAGASGGRPGGLFGR